MALRLYRVKEFNQPKGALPAAGVYDLRWIAAKDIKEVSDKFPKAIEIVQITDELLIINSK